MISRIIYVFLCWVMQICFIVYAKDFDISDVQKCLIISVSFVFCLLTTYVVLLKKIEENYYNFDKKD